MIDELYNMLENSTLVIFSVPNCYELKKYDNYKEYYLYHKTFKYPTSFYYICSYDKTALNFFNDLNPIVNKIPCSINIRIIKNSSESNINCNYKYTITIINDEIKVEKREREDYNDEELNYIKIHNLINLV